jgi:hypothetical protein
MYGIMAEHKLDGPIIMGSKIFDYNHAYERMRILANNPDIIRVAIFKISYEYGNETLINQQETK